MTEPAASSVRVGIDVGGTFTDVILVDDATGGVRITKVPSTPRNPAEGFLQGIDWTLNPDNVSRSDSRSGGLGRSPSSISPEAIRYLAHGTTVATNAIIEGKAASPALLVTRGFRDILEIARQTRPDLFDLFAEKPRPMVPRNHCYEIRERLGPGGEVLEPLDEADVEAAARAILAEGIEAVAICFLHAYAYPEHERRAAEILRARCDGVSVTLSSEVLPRFGEYLRASTTVVNAALLAIVRDYLDEIGAGLAARRVGSPFYVMQSSGGVLSADLARDRPVFIVESGPAAGVSAAAQLAQRGPFADVVAFDMGGTTAKAALLPGGRPGLSPEIEVGAIATTGRGMTRGRGYPIGTPALDLVEVGAGGGSIAWLDSGGMLRVGPQSAGADPGPASYGRGGVDPTVTDANLVLGRLDPSYFLGGEMPLDAGLAERAVKRVADPLGVDVVEAAAAILEIATATMAHAIRLVSTQRGYDVRDFSLVAFGGAGPLHANALAIELAIPRIVIPPSPGIFSALGLLVADVEHDFAVTHLSRFGDLDRSAIETLFGEFARRGREALTRDGVAEPQMDLVRFMDVRYVGQSYHLRVLIGPGEFDAGPEASALEAFHAEHRRAYGYATPDEPVELVNVGLRAIGRTRKPAIKRLDPHQGPIESALRAHRPVFFPGAGFVDCPVYDRYQLGAGARVPGPAIVDEFDSTIVVYSDYAVTVEEDGNLVIQPIG